MQIPKFWFCFPPSSLFSAQFFVYNLSTLSRVISAQWVRSLTHICESSQYTTLCPPSLFLSACRHSFLLSLSLDCATNTIPVCSSISAAAHPHPIYIYICVYIYSVYIFLSDLLSEPAMPRQMNCVCVVAVSLCRSVQFLRKFQSFLMSLTTRSACKGVASAALLD